MKYLKLILLMGFIPFILGGYCNQHDKEHNDKNIVRCPYTQKDIKKAKKCDRDRHKEIGRENECFYCGCPIKMHSKN